MGFWQTTWSLVTGNPVSLPTNLASPFGEPNNLQSAIVGDFFGQLPADVITEEIALRVPEINRALQAHLSLVAPLKLELYRDGERAAEQPAWLTNSASGVSPFHRITGCVRDLFMHGWALVGCEVGADGLPVDMIHIPRSLWSTDSSGAINVDESIPANYRQRLIPIPLGTNGVLSDGIDSIRQARKVELARQSRLDAPPAATELHITDATFDGMTTNEKSELVKSYVDGRNKHSVSVTPSYLEVIERGTSGQLDLFETAMNSLRLQLAMHAGVPASFLEAGKEGGANGQMSYTNENGKASELWVFGSSRIAYAILARLSMDDVAGPGAEIRADMSEFLTPTPDLLSPETPVAAVEPQAPETPTE